MLRQSSVALLGARKPKEPAQDRILVPVANPQTAESLVHLATILARASEDTNICLLTVVSALRGMPQRMSERLLPRLARRQSALLSRVFEDAQRNNAPLYTKMRAASSIAQGILEEVKSYGNDKLILMGWPGPLDPQTLPTNPVNVLIREARTNIGVLLDRGLKAVRRILVPVGGGPHSRLALRIAYEIAEQEHSQITALNCFCRTDEIEEMEDALLLLRDIVEDELGQAPPRLTTRVVAATSVFAGVLAEAERQPNDLMVIGASEEWPLDTLLFGSIDDQLATQVNCSVLLVRHYESAAIAWVRRQTKRIERE